MRDEDVLIVEGRDGALDQLRAICLPLPEAIETGGVGSPSFKVRDKIFAMRHPHTGHSSVWFKAPPGAQQALLQAQPDRYSAPPYVGHRGWVGAWLDDKTDWDFLAHLIEQSYRMTAPKRLLAWIDAPEPLDG